ncbi:hypothetical protein QE152_g22270 [Popillia japonica]|uniref:Inorganic phosphate cotransporter n=1 Tax=Popillia japonica TaxID=7064 RepID=A0AAW1KMB2_POPJA
MYSGFQQAHMDIASHFAATLISLTNTCGTLTGIAVPIFAGWLLDRDPSVYSWRIIFFVTAGFYLMGTFAFGLFAKSEELPWNIDNRRRRDTMLLPRTSVYT